ncbi:MAG: hypothetical protein Q8Q23_05400 [bacterium]|nr:hypothetical protein [bacterium]
MIKYNEKIYFYSFRGTGSGKDEKFKGVRVEDTKLLTPELVKEILGKEMSPWNRDTVEAIKNLGGGYRVHSGYSPTKNSNYVSRWLTFEEFFKAHQGAAVEVETYCQIKRHTGLDEFFLDACKIELIDDGFIDGRKAVYEYLLEKGDWGLSRWRPSSWMDIYHEDGEAYSYTESCYYSVYEVSFNKEQGVYRCEFHDNED